MSTAEELARICDRVSGHMSKLIRLTGQGDGENWLTDISDELRRLAEIERQYLAQKEELAECKAAYESQFKELHALKASIGEPVAWLVLSTNPDGSTSIEYAAEWKDAAHDHISDAIMEYGNTEAGSWIVRPAYAIKDKQP